MAAKVPAAREVRQEDDARTLYVKRTTPARCNTRRTKRSSPTAKLVEQTVFARRRCKIDDPEGWISTKVLMPHSVKQTQEGWKGDIEELGTEYADEEALDPECFADPHALTVDTMKEDMRERYEAQGVEF